VKDRKKRKEIEQERLQDQTILQPEKKKSKAKKVLLIIGCVLAGLIVVALIVGLIYFESLLSLINKADEETLETMSQAEYQKMLAAMEETVADDYTGETLNREDIDWGEEAQALEESDDVINILVIGQDRRESDGENRTRSDVIMLCTVNKPTKTLTLTSFMRDLYVQIPGYDDNRINVPYILGGMNLLDRCLSTNFGVYVDGNVVIDFYSFIDIVDLLGGVEMELTAAEAEYMNSNHSWDVEGNEEAEWNFTEGVHHLSGIQALSYARMRMVGNADYERTERQRKVVSALVEKAKGLSVAELNMLLQHAFPMITSDLENTLILNFALELFPMLPELTVNTLRIPVDGGYESKIIDKMAVLVPNLYWNRVKLAEIMEVPEDAE